MWIDYSVQEDELLATYYRKDANGSLIIEDFEEYDIRSLEIYFKLKIDNMVKYLIDINKFIDINDTVLLRYGSKYILSFMIIDYNKPSEINVKLNINYNMSRTEFYNDRDFYISIKESFINKYSNELVVKTTN